MTKRGLAHLLAVVLVGLMPLIVWAGAMDTVHDKVANEDPRNKAVTFTLVAQANNLAYCVSDLAPEASTADVFRVFLQSAAKLKDHTFHEVYLCFRGKKRFVLSGQDFQTLGQEYGTQNVMYTVRTFPQRLSVVDGGSAYPTRTGPMLVVLREQMEDFADMNKRWYLDTLAAEAKARRAAKAPKVFAPDEDAL